MSVVVTPADAGEVVSALRFGWAMAEVRARFHALVPQPAPSHPAQVPRFLPLAKERSPIELAIETRAVVCGLATVLGIDFVSDGGVAFSARLSELSRALPAGGADAANAFDELLYHWDAKIQDRFAADSFGKATGYLLGRGLGEVSWGLDLGANGSTGPDWTKFLGSRRRDELISFLERLSPYFDPLTVVAVRSSIEGWAKVAASPAWQLQGGIRTTLKEQTHLWRDLLIGERDPRSLIAPRVSPLRVWREGLRVALAFLPNLIIGALSIGLLSFAAWILADPRSSNDHGLGAALAVLGFFGVTGAGLHARAKSMALHLMDEIHFSYLSHLIADEASCLPPPPHTPRFRIRRGISSNQSQRSAPPTAQPAQAPPTASRNQEPQMADAMKEGTK